MGKFKHACKIALLILSLCVVFVAFLLCFPFRKEETAVAASAASAQVVIGWTGGTVTIRGTGTVTKQSDGPYPTYLWLGKPTSYETDFNANPSATTRNTFSGMGIHSGAGSLSVSDGTYVCTGTLESYEKKEDGTWEWTPRHRATATIQVINLPTLTQDSSQRIYSSNYSGRTVTEFSYSHTTSSSYPSAANTAANISQSFTAEGNYCFYVNNGYESQTYTFTIDRTAPVLTLNGVSDGGATSGSVSATWSTATGSITSQISHPSDSLTVRYSRSTSGYPTTASTAYSAGAALTEDGYYFMTISDSKGNSTSYRFFIDRTAPELGNYPSFTNSAFTLTAQDKLGSGETWEYRLNGGAIQRHESASITLGGGEDSNGVWSLRVIDDLGNASKWITVNHVYRESFGNADGIANAYFTPAYYLVTLSQKNYAGASGTYSFSEYVHALNFAINKEWECRVIELEGGKSWNYVTANNENTRQIYSNRAELDAVIDKYARKNVGERKVMGKNGTLPSNPTDATGVTRADALTSQVDCLPPILSAYADLRFMIARRDDSLVTPQSIVDGNKCTATIWFLSDGISLREGAELALRYGEPLESFAAEQGWYLITESDVCGNLERYLIFIDMQQPDLVAEVEYGNGLREEILLNQSFVAANTEAMRYVELSFLTLSDNIDPYSIIEIDGRNLDARYVVGDELPVLSYENGYYGAYTITVYDRSRNVLEFVIYIAGEAPTLKYTSLTNETACTFTVTLNDSRNEITDIRFYKIHFDGSEERLYADSYETAVCAENLVYRMNVGGKYVFEFTDLFGRTVRTNPIFYMKGLPVATLRGVKDGELTKNDVSVTYDVGVTAELYALVNGEWETTDLYELTQGISGNVLRITAGPDTTAVYKVFLYVTADRNLFSEYTFEIDGILPSVDILTEHGAAVLPETVTAESFFVTWTESGYKAYYKRQGALSDTSYVRETLITTAGTYVFTIYDEARNELTFSVTLDNAVSYTLDGTYTLLEDGSYITRGSFVVTVTEPYARFDVEASNGQTVVNGQKLEVDGTYRFRIRDLYGNELSLVLVIDKLPPVAVIETESGQILSNGECTREPFRVLCEEEGVTISYAQGSAGYEIYDGRMLDEAGRYTFRLSDFMGNVATVSVIVDRDLQYRIEGTYILKDGEFHSRTWLQIIALEDVAVFTIETEEGVLLDNTKRINEEGKYFIRLTDTAGNETRFVFVIDKTAPTVRIITASGIEYVGSAIINESFRVLCEESDAKIRIGYNGAFVDYTGGWLTESGRYTVRLTDYLGNVAETEMVVNTDVSFTVNGTYVVDRGVYVSKSWLSVTLGEEMRSFYLRGQDGTEHGADTRITAEGEYELYARDMQGNEVTLRLKIDLTAPEIELVGLSGGDVANTSVTAVFSDYTEAYYRLNGGDKITIESGTVFEEEGNYVLTVRDAAGNASSATFTIDCHVDVTPSVELSEGRVITGTVSFQFGENVAAKLLYGEAESAYVRGEIAAAGDYVLTVTDDVGNVKTFSWTIVPNRAREYALRIREEFSVTVEKDGAVTVAAIDGGVLRLSENGNYVLLFLSEEDRFELKLEVDHVAPTLEFENTGKSIKIFNPNKNDVTYKLYLNGAEKSFRMTGDAELTEIGNYKLVCTDDVGNVTEYEFELNYLSTASVALIAVVSALTVGGVVALIVFRFKRKLF